MREPLRVLLVADDEDDALLVVHALDICGWDVSWERVATRAAMSAALDRGSFDLIVSDYRMPRFRASEALALWSERGLDNPFLVVSSTIVEEQAAELLKAGAGGVFRKDRLAGFCSSVRSALAKAEARRTGGRTERERDEAVRRLPSLAAAIEQAAEGVLITDASGRIEYVNPAAARIAGYSPEELLGQNPRLLKSGVHAPAFYEQMWDTLRAGRVWQGDITNRRQDGALTVVRTTIAPVRDETGTIGHFIALQQDVTDRRKKDEMLRRLQFAIEHTRDGFLWLAADGRILYANDAVCERLGYSRDELLRLGIANILPSLRGEAWPAHWHSVKAAGSATVGGRVHPKEGTPIEVEVSVSHVVFEGSEFECAFIRDISDRRRAEAEHRALEERFRQCQKLEALGRLAGGIAHDFNNLLGVISGHGELMRRELDEADPSRVRLEQILEAADRAAALTHQLLAFSRKQVLRPRVLELNRVVSDMRSMLGRLIGEDIALVTRLDPDLGNVLADVGQIEQVIMNLAVNARDAMPDGGTLTIETSNAELDADCAARHPPVKAGRYVRLAVSDTGTGMDAEVQARLFEPFFTTKGPGQGTGLGLSTAYGIVKQSEGYIWLYSEVGVGATFRIDLPRVDAEPELKGDDTPVPLARGGETVLLVEDEKALRELLRETLEVNGYTVLVAGNAEEGLRSAAEHDRPIHLLVTDVVLPGPSGRKLADELSRTRPQTKVLYISGYTDEAIIRHGIFGPGVPFLSKPFSSEVLLRTITELLGRSESSQAPGE